MYISQTSKPVQSEWPKKLSAVSNNAMCMHTCQFVHIISVILMYSHAQLQISNICDNQWKITSSGAYARLWRSNHITFLLMLWNLEHVQNNSTLLMQY